jgi:hypothetical protein
MLSYKNIIPEFSPSLSSKKSIPLGNNSVISLQEFLVIVYLKTFLNFSSLLILKPVLFLAIFKITGNIAISLSLTSLTKKILIVSLLLHIPFKEMISSGVVKVKKLVLLVNFLSI